MTAQPSVDAQDATPLPSQPTPNDAIPPARKQKNVLGMVAFVISVVGFVFACIPGALFGGWILLPVAFILSLVSLFVKGKGKALGISALTISVVGTVVGVSVFFFVIASSFEKAFTTGDSSLIDELDDEIAAELDAEEADEAQSDERDVNRAGSRGNPYALGTEITQGDWTVTVNSVNLDANQIIIDENPFNKPALEGSTWILANVTATYTGDNPDGEFPLVLVDYVTPGGNTVSMTDAIAVAPEPFSLVGTLYEGASATGNVPLAVPKEGLSEGLLAITPGMGGEKVFVAVK
ncbi:hypothetical protein [Leucobacter sp. USHLN153]|uniref:hypothetical protein n=1 Tax=Leucobacter sp. USHLN153 TaxID=3081268 RepID=UPI00301614FB